MFAFMSVLPYCVAVLGVVWRSAIATLDEVAAGRDCKSLMIRRGRSQHCTRCRLKCPWARVQIPHVC